MAVSQHSRECLLKITYMQVSSIGCSWHQLYYTFQLYLVCMSLCWQFPMSACSVAVGSVLCAICLLLSACWKVPLLDCSTVALALLLPTWLLCVTFENCIAKVLGHCAVSLQKLPHGHLEIMGRPRAKCGPDLLKTVAGVHLSVCLSDVSSLKQYISVDHQVRQSL